MLELGDPTLGLADRHGRYGGAVEERAQHGHVSTVLSRRSTGTADLLDQLRHVVASHA